MFCHHLKIVKVPRWSVRVEFLCLCAFCIVSLACLYSTSCLIVKLLPTIASSPNCTTWRSKRSHIYSSYFYICHTTTVVSRLGTIDTYRLNLYRYVMLRPCCVSLWKKKWLNRQPSSCLFSFAQDDFYPPMAGRREGDFFFFFLNICFPLNFFFLPLQIPPSPSPFLAYHIAVSYHVPCIGICIVSCNSVSFQA